jgi:hypothetical protein
MLAACLHHAPRCTVLPPRFSRVLGAFLNESKVGYPLDFLMKKSLITRPTNVFPRPFFLSKCTSFYFPCYMHTYVICNHHLPVTCSCIPCGHVYGRSCLENWLSACGNTSAKVPDMLLHWRNFINISDCFRSYIHAWQLICSCQLFFLSSALSVVKHLSASILSTSTYQGICGMVAAAYRFLSFLHCTRIEVLDHPSIVVIF